MVVDASFFVRAAHNCGDNNKRQGPEMLGPKERQNPTLVAQTFPQNRRDYGQAADVTQEPPKPFTPTYPHFGVKWGAKRCN